MRERLDLVVSVSLVLDESNQISSSAVYDEKSISVKDGAIAVDIVELAVDVSNIICNSWCDNVKLINVLLQALLSTSQTYHSTIFVNDFTVSKDKIHSAILVLDVLEAC